jgi:hypothetical protein
MYAGHGLTNQMSSPIWDEYKQKNKYSKLEIFLMHLLYGSNIENGDSFETLKEKFPKAYAKTLHTYKRTGGLFYEQLYDD